MRSRLGASFYAAHHVLAKGALFLTVGVVAAANASRLRPVLIITAVMAIGLGGLPLTGGALAKSAVKAQLAQGVIGGLATLSAIGTTMLMLHFLRRLFFTTSKGRMAEPSAGLVLPWLAISGASVAVPWIMYGSVTGGDVREVLSLQSLWGSLWPVLMGGGLAFALTGWLHRLPRLPVGDIAALYKGWIPAAKQIGDAIEHLEAHLRGWPVAFASLLTLTVMLGAALISGH